MEGCVLTFESINKSSYIVFQDTVPMLGTFQMLVVVSIHYPFEDEHFPHILVRCFPNLQFVAALEVVVLQRDLVPTADYISSSKP